MLAARSATKSIGMLSAAGALALAALLGAPVAGASAAPLSLAINTPASGTSVKQSPPLFAGITNGSEPVTVKVFRGTTTGGELVAELTPVLEGERWSASAPALPEGIYTAQAEEHNAAEPGVVDKSEPATFTVASTPPVVEVTSPANDEVLDSDSVSFAGSAGNAAWDGAEVSVHIFEQGSQLSEFHVTRQSSGLWEANGIELAPGQYTVLATQADSAYNVGFSAPHVFTIAPAASSSTTTTSSQSSTSATAPVASFTWLPRTPSVGQSVSFGSSSTDPSSAINSFAWDLAGSGQFAVSGPLATTSFATAGPHVVRLRVTADNGLSSVVSETINVVAAAPKLMQPFPIVRIAGSETSSGATVRLLTVQAPIGATVSVTCAGAGCRTKSESRVATASSKGSSRAGAVTLAFARFERALRAGATLQIRVTQAGEIGKFTSFAIRRKQLPVRTDACLQPDHYQPSACPSS
jgi:PKD repeat protein